MVERVETEPTGLRALARSFVGSVLRHGPPNTVRARLQAIFANLFLHIHSPRTHRWTLKSTFTLGLGVMSTALFGILCVSGVLLMVYYKPAVGEAYASMKDIHNVVTAGRVMRNVHRWAAHLMVLGVLLHMARIFFTGSYRAPRQFNWLIGLGLLVMTLALSFTGYLLPWDQLAYWAITIAANIAGSFDELTDALGVTEMLPIGQAVRRVLLGSDSIAQDALTRFYWLHCIVLPLGLTGALGVHFWRIRKDGGMSRPKDLREEELEGTPSEPQAEAAFSDRQKTYGLMALVKGRKPGGTFSPRHTVSTWPITLTYEVALFLFCLALCLGLAFFFDAPLKEMANPAVPENPAKAPWYFLGLQELVGYSAFMGGVVLPGIVVMGLALIPYLDRERYEPGRWWTGDVAGVSVRSAIFAAIVTIGMLVLTVNLGWIRSWAPDTPQWVIILINPGTVITGCLMIWSILIGRRTGSLRASAAALFSTFLVAFAILTFFATYMRGPNWAFYWWPSFWPGH